MRGGRRIGCIIPACNEEVAIGKVIAAIPDWVDRILVVDNGSTDGTGAAARRAGADVIRVDERGYGAACLGGLSELQRGANVAAPCPSAAVAATEIGSEAIDIVVFLDGDFSDHPQEMHTLVDPIVAGRADMVIGSRVLGDAEPGALTPQQRFGNGLATQLLRWIWGVAYTDLGPFRAIDLALLRKLNMADRTFGWTVEMQIKAANTGLVGIERPVSYRKRIGTSKISGTLSGTVKAGARILTLIAREALKRRR